jgi:hypothetical protein
MEASCYPEDRDRVLAGAPAAVWADLAIGEVLIAALLRDLVQNRVTTPEPFDFNKDSARLEAALAEDLDATPDLHRLSDRAGKLILWHGWADGAISPGATLKLYEAIQHSSGPRANASMRLFMVLGLQHCEGGAGADVFGQANALGPGETPDRSMSAALLAWVETDRKPEMFRRQARRRRDDGNARGGAGAAAFAVRLSTSIGAGVRC